VEISQHRLLFSGRELDRTQSGAVGRIIEHTPKAVQDWLGYKKEMDAAGKARYSFDGERFYMVFQMWALSRLVSLSDRQFRTFAEQPDVAPILIDVLTGLRLKEINLDEEQKKALKERVDLLNRLALRKGLVYPTTIYAKPKQTPP
jgi:hypothetical protein